MKILVVIAALCLSAGAQTVAIPGMLVTIPARAVPAQTFFIDVPKNGGKMSITIPSMILPPQVTSTAPHTAPVSLGNITINFTCTGADMQHLACQAAQQ